MLIKFREINWLIILIGDTSTINWQKYGWANGCDFKGRDFKNVRVSSDRCGPTCKVTLECTHYVWTKFNGGTCWMKNGIVLRSQAILTGDNSMVCGIDSLEWGWLRFSWFC